MTHRLYTFGRLRLMGKSGEPVAFPQKGLLLTAYMLAERLEELPRATAAAWLWDDLEQDQALANLRKTISRILQRQAEIGAALLTFDDRSTIRLDPAAIMADFSVLDAGDGPAALLAVENVGDLFKAGFLEDYEDDPSVRAWVEEKRHALLDRAIGLLMRARQVCTGEAERRRVKELALRLFQCDPEDARIVAILRQAYDEEGNIEKFRRSFENRAFASGWPSGVAPDGQGPPPQGLLSAPAEPILPQARLALLTPGTEARAEEWQGSRTAALAVSLIEDITIGLSAAKSFRMVASHTARQISLSPDRLAMIRRHNIAYVLETTIGEDADGLSLFAQLVYAASDELIWASRFSLKDRALAGANWEMSRRIATSVADQVQHHELSRQAFEHNPAAYQHFLLGQHFLHKLTLPGIRRARREFKQALNASPAYAPALSGLARSHSEEWLLTARGDLEHIEQAERLARQAIAAGKELSAGYRELGVAMLFKGAFDESVDALETAERLSPNYADVIADHADTLVHASNPAKGLQKIELAIDLNPICPDLYHWTAAGAHYHLHNYEQAIACIGRMNNLAPAHRLAAASWAMLGNHRMARIFAKKARQDHPQFEIDKWLAIVPVKENWQREHYREGLLKAGF